jgi:hypothetical protein
MLPEMGDVLRTWRNMTLHPFEGRVEHKTVHRCERGKRLVFASVQLVAGAVTMD